MFELQYFIVMKNRTVITFLALSTSFTIWAQQKQPNSTIPPCNGNSLQSTITLDNSMLFNQVGINLNEYDWSNSVINCHINSTINEFNLSQKYKTYGFIGGVLGVSTFATGYSRRQTYLEDLSIFSISGIPPGPKGTGLLALGTLLTLGGGYTIYLGQEKKKKGDYHLNIVSKYFREMK